MSRSYRFFLRHSALPPIGQKLLLDAKNEPEIFFQLLSVLRAKAQDEVILLSREPALVGEEYHYQIEALHKKEASLLYSGKTRNHNEPDLELELVLCLPNKPEKLEFILQKSVELGVNSIGVVESEFSQMKHQLRPDRLEKILIEAAEQSERAIIPQLHLGTRLKNFLEKFPQDHPGGQLWCALERRHAENLSTLIEKYLREIRTPTYDLRYTKLSLLVGPEGGFSESEKALIEHQKFPCFTLGKRILRMETAAILSLGIVSQYF